MKNIIVKSGLFILAVGLISSITVFRSHLNSLPNQQSINVQKDSRAKNPEPLLVLIKYDPWAMVIGSDSPSFALYDDGTVIYWKSDGRHGKYFSAKLNDDERSQLLQKMNQQEFDLLNNRYEPDRGITDQPEYLIIQRRADRTFKTVYVYGSLSEITNRGTKAEGFPAPLVNSYRVMSGYDNPNASEWLPEYIELMIWPYEYAPDKDLLWPKGWPGLNDPKTVKRDDSYSIFIEKAKISELKSFLSQIRQKQAVRLGGKKWAVSARFPFPQEEIWANIKARINDN